MDEKVYVDKLTEDNFLLWKRRVLALLKEKGLDDILLGLRILPLVPAAGITDSGYMADMAKYRRDVATVERILLTTISDEPARLIAHCKTPSKIWTELLAIYEQKNSVAKNYATDQFYQCRMTSDKTVTQFVAQVKTAGVKLKDLGIHVSDDLIMGRILNGLPESYNNFKTAWYSVTSTEQTLTNLTSRLLSEELGKMKLTDTTSEVESAQAFFSGKRNSKFKKRENFNSQVQNNGVQSSGNQRKTVICHYCKKPGHIARNCYKKQNSRRDQDGASGSSNLA